MTAFFFRNSDHTSRNKGT